MSDLEPIEPEEAKKIYLNNRKPEVSFATFRTIKQGLRVFFRWVEEYDLANMNELSGRDLIRYKDWRRNQDIKEISLNGELAVVRRFLVFCKDIEAVEEGIPDKVPMPEVSEEDEVRKDAPSDEQVHAVNEYLSKYEYASRRHVEHRLMAEIGLRRGDVRAIDECDYHPEEKKIELRHRPEGVGERGTPLKNGSESERNINISAELRDLIDDFLENPARPEGTDKYGRKPLFTTEDADGTVNRVSLNQITDDLYVITRPCEFGGHCPIDRDIDECKAAKNRFAYKCPENYTPHRLRSWAIMRQLDAGVNLTKLSDRVDVSVPVLKKHYDERGKERKRTNRLPELNESLPEYGDEEGAFNDTFDGTTSIVNPVLALLIVASKMNTCIVNRLYREMESLSPNSDLFFPEKHRIAKAGAAYILFVGLIALNFVLFNIGGHTLQ